MVWKFPKRPTNSWQPRKNSHENEMCRAVEQARRDQSLPQDTYVSIEDVARVGPKYWGVSEGYFRVFMKKCMTPEQRAHLRISEPTRKRPGMRQVINSTRHYEV